MNDLPHDLLLSLLSAGYDLAPPLRIDPLEDGANNRSFQVRSGDSAYVLKWLHNTFAIEQLGFQNELLVVLDALNLPFAVPTAVPTRNGAPVYVGTAGDRSVVLTMSPLIPGAHPGVGDPVLTYACGRALGQLDQALTSIELNEATSIPLAIPPLEDELPRPTVAFSLLYSQMLGLLEEIESMWLEETAGWTQQIIHGDYFSPNVLVLDGEVTGILDFEFAGMGHRAMDLAIGLRAFALRHELFDKCWPLIEAFATGYLSQLQLSSEELNAIPTLLLKRESSSFAHWMGRAQVGLTVHVDIAERAERLQVLHKWIGTHRSSLTGLLCQVAQHS